MSPTSENTSMLLIALIAAATALAAHFGGFAPLAALLGGILLKQLNPRPWAWPRQLGNAASLLTMLMFVLVAVVAAKADWNPAVAGLVAALVLSRGIAKVLGVGAANWGSGTSWRQAFWTGCAMSPMSSVALLLVQQFMSSSLTLGPRIASIPAARIAAAGATGTTGPDRSAAARRATRATLPAATARTRGHAAARPGGHAAAAARRRGSALPAGAPGRSTTPARSPRPTSPGRSTRTSSPRGRLRRTGGQPRGRGQQGQWRWSARTKRLLVEDHDRHLLASVTRSARPRFPMSRQVPSRAQ
jgi:hypothetical protein